MATFEKKLLSASANGRGIKVVGTNAGAATLLHTAVAGAVDFDEVWLYAVNSDATARKLTLLHGGVTSPDDEIEVTIPPESGLFLVAPGLLLQNGLDLKAFAAAGNVILIHGYVHRITA